MAATMAVSHPSTEDGINPRKQDMLCWEAAHVVASALHKLMASNEDQIGIRARVIPAAMSLFRRFFSCRSFRRNDHVVIAGASLLTALKLCDVARAGEDVARAVVTAGIETTRLPVHSTEISNLFQQVSDRHTHAVWQDTCTRLWERMRLAEISVLHCVEWHNLPDIGWEWQVVLLIEKLYKLERCPGWADVGGGGAHARARDSASNFLVDCAKYSTAQLQWSPTTIAVAAVQHAMAAHGLVWKVQADKESNTKVDCLEHYALHKSVNSRLQTEKVDLDAPAEVQRITGEAMSSHRAFHSRSPTLVKASPSPIHLASNMPTASTGAKRKGPDAPVPSRKSPKAAGEPDSPLSEGEIRD